MPYELTKHHNHYLELLHKDEIPDHKKFEYLYALELDMINWDDLPPTFDEQFNVPHKILKINYININDYFILNS